MKYLFTATDPRRKGLFSMPLVRELAVVLIIKLAILYFIWFAFFSNPVATGLTTESVAETFIGGESGSPQRHNNSK